MERIKHVQAYGRTKLFFDGDMVLDLDGTIDLVGIMKMVYAAGKNLTPINFMREHLGETKTTTSTDIAEAAPPPPDEVARAMTEGEGPPERETETIHDVVADPFSGKPQAEEAGK